MVALDSVVSAVDEVERLLVTAESEFARAYLGRANGADDAESEESAAESVRALVGRAIEDPSSLAAAAPLEPYRVAALAAHAIRLYRRVELARATDGLERLRARVHVVDDVSHSLGSFAAHALAGRADRPGERALEAILASRGRARAEAEGRAELATRGIAALAARDRDRPRARGPERAARFLDATEELATEALAYLGGGRTTRPRTLGELLSAMRVAHLDDLVPATSRGRRMASLLAGLGLERPLVLRGARGGSRPEPAYHARVVAAGDGRATLVESSDTAGLVSEVTHALAVGRVLEAVDDVAYASPLERRPRRGLFGRTLGVLVARELFDPRRLAARRAVPAAVLERARRTAACALVLLARLSAVGASPADRDGVARALGVEVGEHTAAALLHASDGAAWFDAFESGLSLYVGMRERYDEDFFSHPRAAEELRELRRRVPSRTLEETLYAFGGLGGRLDEESRVLDLAAHAAAELRVLFEGRYR